MNADLEGKLEIQNPLPDLLGGMGGTIVQDQMENSDALRPEILENHQEKILELHEPLPGEAPGHRLAGVHQQSRKQVQDSLPLVAGSVPHRCAGLGGIDSASKGQRLHARLLIGADAALSPSSQDACSFIEIQNDRGFCEEFRVGRLLPGMALPGLDLLLPEPLPDGGGRNV